MHLRPKSPSMRRKGSISAPASSIDVSGLWINESADAGALQIQLNSYQLRDDFAQKGGVLQGQTITMSSVLGSAIGDVSGAYSTQPMTPVQWHTGGG